MVKWIEIKIEDLYNYLVAVQVDALRKVELAKLSVDPLVGIIQDTSLKIRSHIASNRKNILSQSPYTLPPELKSLACILVIETAQTRIPGLKLTEDQIRLANEARNTLQKIARGEIKISLPDDSDAIAKNVEVVHSREEKVLGRAMKGL